MCINKNPSCVKLKNPAAVFTRVKMPTNTTMPDNGARVLTGLSFQTDIY